MTRRGWEEYPQPIRVANGIRARSRRGEIGETWWSRRFLEALASRIDERRLARGKGYARAGQVVSLTVAPGSVTARVQGSRPRPYAVRLGVPVLDDRQWQAVETEMATRAVFLARLLAGEMPTEIEEAFAAAGTVLFAVRQIQASCTCPDTSPLCKHIAAVFFLLAEAFDADPFLMLAWRGRSRAELLRDLRELRPASQAPSEAGTLPAAPPEALEAGFWDVDLDLAELRAQVHPTTPPDAMLREADRETIDAVGRQALAALARTYWAFVPAAREQLEPSATGTRTRTRSRRNE
ncbi:MAG: SWIM zinc finger family protein [Candidatus Limnocylindrales bacterium]